VSEGAGLPQVGQLPEAGQPPADAGSGKPGPGATQRTPPHDVPSATDLLEAVHAFLSSDVLPVTEGRVQFHVRVAANVIAMVVRELTLGPEQATAHAARLARFGVADEAELAAAIRSGALDDRMAEVRAAVRDSVADKLAVANPGYMGHDAAGGPGTPDG
jgi:hypothetical protein